MRSDEKLTAFLELKSAIRAVSTIVLDEQVRFFQDSELVLFGSNRI